MKRPEFCRDEERRIAIRGSRHEDTNGIDYIEASDDEHLLVAYFLREPPTGIRPENVRIEGGERIRDIKVVDVKILGADDEEEDVRLVASVDKPGDFSTYTLRLVEADPHGRPSERPLPGFDPLYASADFSFKAGCPTDLDCLPEDTCPPALLPEPEVDYLAKDYSSFRQVILDRLALIMPDWRERHVPDLGITLVELLAYTGDYLSYYQDAVATEAYLDTARRRTSVRRHARLVDYAIHDGCNARAWVRLETEAELKLNPRDIFFVTDYDDILLGDVAALNEAALMSVSPNRYEVFEPVVGRTLHIHPANSVMSFYTWGNRECCLPRGSTSATLRDHWADASKPPHHEPPPSHGAEKLRREEVEEEVEGEIEEREQEDKYHGRRRGESKAEERRERKHEAEERREEEAEEAEEREEREQTEPDPMTRPRKLRLEVGDILIFAEVLGPKTGIAPDADRLHRHAVRLTHVTPGFDPLYRHPVVEIEWAAEDALPFPLCISAIGPAPACNYLPEISLAWGNVVLVDHGRPAPPEIWTVPDVTEQDAGCDEIGEPHDPVPLAAPFAPALAAGPLTRHVPFPTAMSISRSQAESLARLLPDLRAWVQDLWHRAQAGQQLTTEEIEELRVVFGNETLEKAGLTPQEGKRRSETAVLRYLLARENTLLARKARRVDVLLARSQADYVMSDAEVNEIREMFGSRFAVGVNPGRMQILESASGVLAQDPRSALPSIRLAEEDPLTVGYVRPAGRHTLWIPKPDLLGSAAGDRDFVVENEDDGSTHIRFGNGELGRAPSPGAAFTANYRVGNGTPGNVAAGSITHIVFRQNAGEGIKRVDNPMPAKGGIDPEPMADVKLLAPGACRTDLQRAVTADDYARLAERHPRVQRAAASLRWNGSWYEVDVAIDPLGSEDPDDHLLAEIAAYLYRYQRIGHDLAVLPARYVPLQIAMNVCVLPHYLRGHIKAALRDVFGNSVLPNGRLGFFHPDNLSFGQGIYLSQLIGAAQAVPGVESVEVTTLQRLYARPNSELANGVLALGPLEVARLDNDPSFPEHGQFTLTIGGGR